MHIRIYRIAACIPLKRLPPTQMVVLLRSNTPTPVAPMRLTSQLTLSLLVTIGETPENHFHFQITHNSVMG
jgi:hypothetical protein